jgi:hypothetical protein
MSHQHDPLASGDVTGRHSILRTIHEGMIVNDNAGERIGKVDFVHFGVASETEQEHGVGPATPGHADSVDTDEDTVVGMIADAFDDTDIPHELRRKLLQEGYVRMNADGLFTADRFITPDQIDAVREHDLELNVTRDQLIKRR